MTHTPGPWSFWPDPDSDSDYHYVGLPDRRDEMNDYTLRYAEQHTATAWGEANARLIAAAPELLAAAEAATAYCPPHVQDQLRAAIRRARGEE